ncbi:MAG: calcium/sodium antiporter [Gammaproteobacteria bacterium]|nr:calcium/sodium antiporter [Gammaproteobacteria bacterium]|tara:strand:- start:9731 stop:10666 length:936 start_codon:yes stop_codon:yes gene_type:complete
MLILLATIILSFAILYFSVDKFIRQAECFGSIIGLSPIVIGIIIVGLATSMPEILTSVFSALQGNPNIGLGNAIGSNITNIALIIGGIFIFAPSSIKTLKAPMLYILIGSSIVFYFFIYDFKFSMEDGLASLLVLLLSLTILIFTTRDSKESYNYPNNKLILNLFWLLLWATVLCISSKGVVWSASGISQLLGISNLTIGITLVALGTSLPELITSIISIVRKRYDIAIGNVIGSNLFNMLGAVGSIGLISEITVPSFIVYPDYWVMISLTILLLLISLTYRVNERLNISSICGIILVIIYLLYTIYVLSR